MTRTTSSLRFLSVAALLTGTFLVAGCSSPDKVTRTTTTEQTTTAMQPQPVTSSTTTTTTRQSQP